MVTAKVEVFVGTGELCEVESQLLLRKRATGKVGLLHGARGCTGGDTGTFICTLVAQFLHACAMTEVSGVTGVLPRLYILLDPVDEVQLDAFHWDAVDDRLVVLVGFVVLVEFPIRVLARLVLHVDNSVVLEASRESGVQNFRIPRPAHMHLATRNEQTDVDPAQLLIGVQRAHPIVDLLAIPVACRRVCQWRVKTVQMPAFATVVALDDGPSGMALRGFAAMVTKHGSAFAVLQLIVVWKLIVATAVPVRC